MDFDVNFVTIGDARELLLSIGDEEFDGIITDPPYGISYYSNRAKTEEYRARVKSVDGIAGDDHEEFMKLVATTVPQLYRVLKNDSWMLWFTNWRMSGTCIYLIEKVGFKVKNALIWDKVSKGMGDLTGSFGNAYEVILLAAKGRPLIIGDRVRDIAQFNRVHSLNRIHSHQKPVDLLNYWTAKTVGAPGRVVLDPFAGSGSTVRSSIMMGNKCVAFEIDSMEARKANSALTILKEELVLGTQLHMPGFDT